MLNPAGQRGVTLIELVITLIVAAFMMMLAAPSITSWIQGMRIRTSAEAILNGLQTAKAEGVARNTRVRFQLTSSASNDCLVSKTGTSWAVNVDPTLSAGAVEGHCGDAPDDTVEPRLLQVRAAADGTVGVAVEGSSATVVFDGIGRPMAGTGNVTFDVSFPAGGACAVDGGTVTCLRVLVTQEGLLRMCNPKLTVDHPSDPRAC